jgi:hypothetical protein
VIKRLVNGLGSGVGVGIGIGVAFGAVTVVRGGDARPILRGAVKGVAATMEFVGRKAAEAREEAEDLYHEAQAERLAERLAREGNNADQGTTATVVLTRRG